MTNDSSDTYSAPKIVAIHVARPSCGSVRANAATATSTMPTAPSSSPLPSRTVGNAASRTIARASAVPERRERRVARRSQQPEDLERGQ